MKLLQKLMKGMVTMIKNILVPVSASPGSKKVVTYAVSLSKQLEAQLRFLYVKDKFKMHNTVINTKSFTAGLYDQEESKRESLQEEVGKRLVEEKGQVETLLEGTIKTLEGEYLILKKSGATSEIILKEGHSSDLIIMGRSPQKHKKLKGILELMLSRCKTPLLSVSESIDPVESILLAYDGSPSSKNAMKVMGNLLVDRALKVIICTVKKKEKDANRLFKEVETYFKPYKAAIERVWSKEDVTGSIIKAANETKTSLIVMGGYGDNIFKEFLLGSSTETVLASVKIPVLLCNH